MLSYRGPRRTRWTPGPLTLGDIVAFLPRHHATTADQPRRGGTYSKRTAPQLTHSNRLIE